MKIINKKKLILIVLLLTISGLPHSSLSNAQRKGTTNGPTTSEEAKKQQRATENEIRETEQQLKENEKQVKKELTQLGKLEGEIQDTQGKIKILNGRLTELSGKINSLEAGISKNEKELEKLRAEYLKAVKKMRVTRKNKSDLAFIFSSSSFNQAIRRMRYLREFSDWKNRQSSEINAKIADLKNQKDALAKAREEEKNALTMQKNNEKRLEIQHNQEETLLAQLREHGEALQSHLKKKQAEANKLNSLVSNLIAQEQQQREAQRQKEEAKRQEELRRKEEERQKEEQRKREEQRMKEEQLAQNSVPKPEPKNEPVKKEPTVSPKNEGDNVAEAKPRQRKKKETSPSAESGKKVEVTTMETDDASEFARVRKRAPRGETGTAKQNEPEVKAANFQDMKGKLPNPVAGSFKVTSRFGRQTLPDLPGVEYDNPGIDAEVNTGASALAVYKGKVSGVYLLPGYNTVVIVNHDGYYTVYGNIASASVKVGDTVNTGQTLGTVVADDDNPGHGTIHFEVWKNREKMNPMEWLK